MSQFEQYLKTSLSKYRNAEAVKREILNIFAQYRDLRPMLESFVFNDGTQKELLNLQGTIPVGYKGALYNIPVCIWILETHPQNPPMVYIKPTNTMQIKPSRYVDANGKVDLPFLRDWKSPMSDLVSLIQVLTLTFGEECPVFSKIPPRPPPYQPGGHASASGQFPPYPTSSTGNMPMPSISGAGTTNPPYPQYPSSAGYSSSNYPPYPAQQGSYPPTSFGNYPPPTSTYQGSQPYPQYSYGNPGSYPPPNYPLESSTPVSSSSSDRPSTGTVTEEHIRASLLSAVEDKIRWRLREILSQGQAEMDVLKNTQRDLNIGKESLNNMISSLKLEKDEVERNIQLLQQKDNELKEALARLENSSNLDIDKAVNTTTPLYRQLLNAFAEEQAIEDAIYYLGEALRKGVIDLEVFLKQVRELSRRQFLLRALIIKCREKAGLPPMA